MIKKGIFWFLGSLLFHVFFLLLNYQEEIFDRDIIVKCNTFTIVYAIINSLIIGILTPWLLKKQKEDITKKKWFIVYWIVTDLSMCFILYIQQVSLEEFSLFSFILTQIIGLLGGVLAGYLWIKSMFSIAKKEELIKIIYEIRKYLMYRRSCFNYSIFVSFIKYVN